MTDASAPRIHLGPVEDLPSGERRVERESTVVVEARGELAERKEEDFFDAQRKGNHEAIIARQPSWTINGSKLRDIQRQYRQEFGIPEGLTIAKKFKDLGWQ